MNPKFICMLSLIALILIGLANSGANAWSCEEGCERNHSGNQQKILECQRAGCKFDYEKAYEVCKSGGGCDAYLRYSDEAFTACQRNCNDACKAVGGSPTGSPGHFKCAKKLWGYISSFQSKG